MNVILIILDSVGIGAAPDAAEYGDTGANTVSAVASSGGGVQYGGAVTYATGANTGSDGAVPCMTTTAWNASPQLRWSISYTDPNGQACTGHDLALSGAKLFVAGSAGGAFLMARYDTTTVPLVPPVPD